VRVVQVAGSSGAGKSALSRHLRNLGQHTVSTDGADGVCRWVNSADAIVERPPSPSVSWLGAHRWVWDIARFVDMVASLSPVVRDGTLFVCGSAANDDLVSFDAIVLLDIDEPTMVARVLDPARGNDFGRIGDSLEALVADLPAVRERYLRRGAVVVDATQPLSTVAAAVLASA
jgi:broad-specificity NMP kinase